ncbi:MAG: N-acetyltransferase [Herpetosiphonaceae bacterium]|nr:MAG: N-acetyltransferase [Herpetosiphonaceae bacterium]
MIREIILATERLKIRPWERRDYYAMDRWPPFTEALSLIWNLPQAVSAGRGSWPKPDIRRAYAVENHDGQLIGRISLREIDRARGSARLGISFGSPYVGQGLGTEALSHFLDAYFGPLGFRVMVLDVAAPNVRAVRSYQKLGFRITGRHWRDAGESISRRLQSAIPPELERHFRWGVRSLWIEFYDMELTKAEWLDRRARSRTV